MNSSPQNHHSKTTLAIVFISIWFIGSCLFAMSSDRFYPMTKAHLYENFGYFIGLDKQKIPEYSIREVARADIMFAGYGLWNRPSAYYHVVRQLSEIPESENYKIRMISLSDSSILKTATIVRMIHGVDIDGTPVDIKNKTINL